MNKAEVDNYCGSLPVLDVVVPEEGIEFSMVLQPVPPKDGASQYWPLFEVSNPNELFGNMKFHFRENSGVVKINLTLDVSKVPGRDLEFAISTSRKLDGLLALSPDFRHQFIARAKRVDGRYTKLKITIKDKEHIQDNFSFLWLCETVDGGMHYVSGDPDIQVDTDIP
ncbi:hypothetical protein [Microbulbifer sp. Q7]|uniref:hypothetical protein n=1 Tax=Microbulbifer sp. Q7 TaxID=1785091 RepID=UPI000B1FFBC4|nr:hypothetical protein [Microbulbifer sp. Q7]